MRKSFLNVLVVSSQNEIQERVALYLRTSEEFKGVELYSSTYLSLGVQLFENIAPNLIVLQGLDQSEFVKFLNRFSETKKRKTTDIIVIYSDRHDYSQLIRSTRNLQIFQQEEEILREGNLEIHIAGHIAKSYFRRMMYESYDELVVLLDEIRTPVFEKMLYQLSPEMQNSITMILKELSFAHEIKESRKFGKLISFDEIEAMALSQNEKKFLAEFIHTDNIKEIRFRLREKYQIEVSEKTVRNYRTAILDKIGTNKDRQVQVAKKLGVYSLH